MKLNAHFPAVLPVTAPERRGPNIYYILDDDEPTRGDSHGYAGIGRTMARKLGGRFFQVDDENLEKLYPQESGYERQCSFLRDYGPADVVICRSRHMTHLYTDNDTIIIEGRNENLGTDLESDMLVAHHLTPDLLKEEGRKFSRHYAGLNEAVIGVLLVENSASARLFGQSLVRHALHSPQATIFLTTCWRTPEGDYEAVMQACRDAIKAHGAEDRVRVLSYHLNEEKRNGSSYNPYAGLLDRADHLILWGRSYSMLSEAISTGKTVHVNSHDYKNEGYKKLEEKGVIRNLDFETAVLKTRKGPALNKTDDIADRMIRGNQYYLRKKGMLPAGYDFMALAGTGRKNDSTMIPA